MLAAQSQVENMIDQLLITNEGSPLGLKKNPVDLEN